MVATPRVHSDDIEYREDPDDPWADEDLAFHHGEPFTGIVWWEFHGCVHERSYRDGERHGVSRSFYPDGSKMSEGSTEAGEDAWEWYPSGQVKQHVEYDDDNRMVARRSWTEAGVLVSEHLFDEDVVRTWYAGGELMHEHLGEVCTYYGVSGDWAFRFTCGNPSGESF